MSFERRIEQQRAILEEEKKRQTASDLQTGSLRQRQEQYEQEVLKSESTLKEIATHPELVKALYAIWDVSPKPTTEPSIKVKKQPGLSGLLGGFNKVETSRELVFEECFSLTELPPRPTIQVSLSFGKSGWSGGTGWVEPGWGANCHVQLTFRWYNKPVHMSSIRHLGGGYSKEIHRDEGLFIEVDAEFARGQEFSSERTSLDEVLDDLAKLYVLLTRK